MKSHLSIVLGLLLLSAPLSSSNAIASPHAVSINLEQTHTLNSQLKALNKSMIYLDDKLTHSKYHEMTNMERQGFILMFSKQRTMRGIKQYIFDTDELLSALNNTDKHAQNLNDFAELMRSYYRINKGLTNPRYASENDLRVQKELKIFESLLKASYLKQWTKVVKLSRYISSKSDLYWRVLNQLSLANLHSRQLRSAHDFASKAIKLNPKNPYSYFNRGFAFALVNQKRLALNDYHRAIGFSPENALYYNNRGFIYQKMGKYELSIEDFSHAIARNHKNANYFSNRGDTYHLMENYAFARADFSRAIELNPRKGYYHFARGNSFLKDDQHLKAINDYSHTLDLGLRTAWVYHNRGYSYSKVKQNPKGLNDLNRAIALSPKTTHFYNTRTDILNALVEYRPMGRDFQILTSKAPGAKSYFGRGRVNMHHRNYTQAVADFTRALTYNRKMGAAFFYRGQSYRELAQCQKANSDFSQACALGEKQSCNHYCEEGLGPTRHLTNTFVPVEAPETQIKVKANSSQSETSESTETDSTEEDS